MALACPRCRCPLATASSSIVTIGQCTDCGGVWLSAAAARTVDAALDRVAQGAAERGAKTAAMPFQDRGGSAEVACPACGETCLRYPVAGVEVDHCRAHGTWYDAGELKQVAATLRETHPNAIDRPEPLPPPPAKEASDEPSGLKKFVDFMTKMRGPEVGPLGGSALDRMRGPEQRAGERFEDYRERHNSHYNIDDNPSTAFAVADAFFDISDIW